MSLSSDPIAAKNQVGFSIYSDYGFYAPRTALRNVKFNGVYRGLYLETEAIEPSFFRARELKQVTRIFKAKAGADLGIGSLVRSDRLFEPKNDHKDPSYMNSLLTEINKASHTKNWQQLDRIFNLESYLKYIAISVFLHHWDGFKNNYYLGYTEGRFLIIPWDLDKIWQNERSINIWCATYLMCELLKEQKYLDFYKSQVHDLLKNYPVDRLMNSVYQQQNEWRESWNNDPYLASKYSSLDLQNNLVREFMVAWHKTLREQFQ